MKKPTEKSVLDQITHRLNKANIDFQQEIIVSGSPQDLFVNLPKGGTATFEIKTWEPTHENISFAESLAKSYLLATGADFSFVVIPELKKSSLSTGVISPNDFDSVIQKIDIAKDKSALRIIRNNDLEKMIFVAMPFSNIYNDTYAVAIQPSCSSCNYRALRIDHLDHTADMVNKIMDSIDSSVGVIADISESRPNVLYEMGYARAKGKEIIQICSIHKGRTKEILVKNLPFDISHFPVTFYNIGGTHNLKSILVKKVANIFKLS